MRSRLFVFAGCHDKLACCLGLAFSRRTVSCNSSEYTDFLLPYGVISLLVFPIGINLFYIRVLWKNRGEICFEKNEQANGCATNTALTILHKPFSRDCFWWEAVDSVRAFNVVPVEKLIK